MKKKTKPTSIRFDDELLEELDQRCEKVGCSRNDFIKNSVEFAITLQSDFDFGEEEEESEEGSRIIVENVPDDPIPMAHGKIYDDNGNLVGTF